MIEISELRKEFLLSHGGVASFKTLFLWWKRKKLEKLEVLKGISFTVNAGECVAVIGRNGAGKSTLLSLLARVYKPTSGSIEVHGRMAPLLELGAGFHPDLTGHENVMFNGMILGLSRKEVAAKMDEIVAFSGLEEYMDAPVRSYSSGMLARLGFSVAAHVDPEILVVDEVLAVGDYVFEKKCFRYIDEFRERGGTILFVSHDMAAVKRVADRCLWLSEGNIEAQGDPEEVISRYRAAGADQDEDRSEPEQTSPSEAETSEQDRG
ncbi:MAG: ABC transporter ATP-binding protein [Fimbriimonadaceae bacterium]